MSRMKLILTQEVGGLGTPGDVVDVARPATAATTCSLGGSRCRGRAARRSRST